MAITASKLWTDLCLQHIPLSYEHAVYWIVQKHKQEGELCSGLTHTEVQEENSDKKKEDEKLEGRDLHIIR